MPFTNSTTEELNLLLQFDKTTSGSGIKVHSSARQEVISASQSLFDKGLISQADGGYLTDAGIEALAHVEVLAGLLGKKRISWEDQAYAISTDAPWPDIELLRWFIYYGLSLE